MLVMVEVVGQRIMGCVDGEVNILNIFFPVLLKENVEPKYRKIRRRKTGGKMNIKKEEEKVKKNSLRKKYLLKECRRKGECSIKHPN